MTVRIPKDINRKIYQQLAKAFETNNAAKIGRELGIERQSVYQWRDGVSAPTPDKLVLAREKTGVSVDWLFTGEGPKYIESLLLQADPDSGFDKIIRGYRHLRALPSEISDAILIILESLYNAQAMQDGDSDDYVVEELGNQPLEDDDEQKKKQKEN